MKKNIIREKERKVAVGEIQRWNNREKGSGS